MGAGLTTADEGGPSAPDRSLDPSGTPPPQHANETQKSGDEGDMKKRGETKSQDKELLRPGAATVVAVPLSAFWERACMGASAVLSIAIPR